MRSMEFLGEEVYCTLVTNDAYVIGAKVVSHALRRAGATRKLAILVTVGVSKAKCTELQEHYDYVLVVEKLSNKSTSELTVMGRPDLAETFTKIALWQQTQFSRIVYLDADTLPLRAPDELFDTPVDFAAAPELGFPDTFNSGVMVLRPSRETFEQLRALAMEGISFDGGDQGVLNIHFNEFHRLSFMYNMELYKMFRLNMPAVNHYIDQLSVVHFIGKEKPWNIAPEDVKCDESPYSHFYARMHTKWRAIAAEMEGQSQEVKRLTLGREDSVLSLP